MWRHRQPELRLLEFEHLKLPTVLHNQATDVAGAIVYKIPKFGVIADDLFQVRP